MMPPEARDGAAGSDAGTEVGARPPTSARSPAGTDTAPSTAPVSPPHHRQAEQPWPSPAPLATQESTVATPADREAVEPVPGGLLAGDAPTVLLPLRDAPLPPFSAALPAGRSPAPAQPAPSLVRPLDADPQARAGAGRALATYAHALESSDIQAVEWVYPAITERERTAWKRFFSVARDVIVTLNIEQFAMAGSEAHLDVRGTYQYWNRSLRRSEQARVRFVATVKRDGDTWHLTAIR